MRIAFDVKGTIEGPKKSLVLRLFKGLQAKGHICVVWSNYYGYAVDAIKDNGLVDTQPMDKKSLYDFKEYGQEPMDVCIEDDRSQTWLGSRRIIFVDELDNFMVETLIRDI